MKNLSKNIPDRRFAFALVALALLALIYRGCAYQ